MRTIIWNDERHTVDMIDQRLLPEILKINHYKRYQAVADAIHTMVIRGAPAIGVAAAFGIALAAYQSKASSNEKLLDDLETAGEVLKNARPTAVNLSWAIHRMLAGSDEFKGSADDLREYLLNLAKAIAYEDVAINKRLSEYGAVLIEDGDHIVHHCNTGALATVGWGTALGVIRMAHEQGKKIHVFVDETRPRLQGARLTAWELEQYGISYDIITDNSSGYLMRRGLVQKVIFGADRVAINGDVANKVGSYMLALAAYDNGIPAYSTFPISTIDFNLDRGDLIPIEEREEAEVLELALMGHRVTPQNASARNFAFDITPARLISAWIIEKGVIYPPFNDNLQDLMIK